MKLNSAVHDAHEAPVRRQAGRRLTNASGFSLIELLVAVLVLGVGVLGVAGLQVISLQNNRDALNRSDAVSLAYDMMDRIRANPGGPDNYAIALEAQPPNAASCVGISAQCDPGAMAAYDLSVWKCVLGSFDLNAVCQKWVTDTEVPAKSYLPSGDGAVTVAGDTVTIRVQWVDASGQLRAVVIESQV